MSYFKILELPESHLIHNVQVLKKGESTTGLKDNWSTPNYNFHTLSNVRVTRRTRLSKEDENTNIIAKGTTILIDIKKSLYDGLPIEVVDTDSGYTLKDIKEEDSVIISGDRYMVKQIRCRDGFEFHHFTVNLE
jgi:hypothetical protein